MKKVVLFDFHNTLATCDGWLDLEIKTLPGLVLAGLTDNGTMQRPTPSMMDDAARIFQEVRQEVRSSGVELSALEGTRQVLAQMGVSAPDAELARTVEQLEHDCLPEVEMVEGADKVLDRLREVGCRLGIVSSAGYPPFVEMALEKIGLRAYFSEIVTSTGEGIYKSNPDIFRRAVAKLGATPEEAVHVGDHPVYDVQTAKAAGLSAIWFAAHARRTATLHGQDWQVSVEAGSRADAVIEQMDELYEAIEGLGAE